jgi:hypothetical protein
LIKATLHAELGLEVQNLTDELILRYTQLKEAA